MWVGEWVGGGWVSACERKIDRYRQTQILKFGISLWHIDKHGGVLTVRERERERERKKEREREREGGRFVCVICTFLPTL